MRLIHFVAQVLSVLSLGVDLAGSCSMLVGSSLMVPEVSEFSLTVVKRVGSMLVFCGSKQIGILLV